MGAPTTASTKHSLMGPSKASAAAPVVNNSNSSGAMELGQMTGPGGSGAAAIAAAAAVSDGKQDGFTGAPAAEVAENDIMQLARIGDVPAMEKLFEEGEYDATYHDDEGITPLHWAAINNQYAMCKFLIEHGAEINRKGGESVSTPLQWAAQRCHYYTVNLLLQHGADPLVTDSQGYNTLHISTFNGNVLLLVLLLHQGIPVDVLDSYGHTALMWAAYKGYPRCVDLFLRWGASVHATDEQGFTALHWALVKGSPACILKLIEYGADRFATTEAGKTPASTAAELNTYPAWHRALKEAGYDEDGHPTVPGWPGSAYMLQDRKGFINKFTFLWPSLILYAGFSILSGMPIFAAVPVAGMIIYGLLWVAQQVMEHAPADMRHFSRTPWMAGIFAGTLFWAGVNWLFTILAGTWNAAESEPGLISLGVGSKVSVEGDGPHGLLNLTFFVCFCLVVYFYSCSMGYDPGFVPRMNGIAEQKAVIDELLGAWKFDESNFCVTCMIRAPLRSKHCKKCQRCVARHDHHCPWVNNCIGVNNHRHFLLYIISLAGGILSYDWLLYYYLSHITENASGECTLLTPSLCQYMNADGYAVLIGIWVTIQLVWILMLMSVQFLQVARAMTTYENMYGIRDSSQTAAFTSTGTPLDPSLVGPDDHEGHGHGHGYGHGHGSGGHDGRKKGGCFSQIAMLLGVTPFIETVSGRTAGTAVQKKRKGNPYGHGVVTNCSDFWCDPAPLWGQRENGEAVVGGHKVSYLDMYEVPDRLPRRRRGGYERVEAMV